MMKKKKRCRTAVGLLPIFNCTGLRYNNLYRDTGLGGWPGRNQGGHDTTGLVRSRACDTATAWPRYKPRYGQPAPGACGNAHGLAREIVAIQKFVLWLRGRLWVVR